MRQKRTYTKEYKRQIIEEVQSGSIVLAEALRKYELNSSTYYNWVQQYDRGRLDNTPSPQGALLNKVAELERKVGQLTMENDLLKKLRELQRQARNANSSGGIISGPRVGGAK